MDKNTITVFGKAYLFWGAIALLLALFMGLVAYYLHHQWMREGAFVLVCFSVFSLFLALQIDLNKKLNSTWISYVISFGVLILYALLRIQLNRFDFGVGDASDYYVAGVCSVTFGQDIGFFLPLTASVSAIGYSILGSDYAPWIHVVLYASSVPIMYFIFRELGVHIWVSLFMTIFIVLNPLSIWFSKTSFSEPIWQLLLLVCISIFYRIISSSSLRMREILGFYLILALVPFVRGEGVLYYGIVFFIVLYHFWKFSNLKSALLLGLGLLVLAVSIYITLNIREQYLLGWQFSRVIPGITPFELMRILYGVSGIAILMLFVLNYFKYMFTRMHFSLVVTILAIVFKVLIAYTYSQKKAPSFLDFLFRHEYGLAVGNFGLPLTLFIATGLVILHYKAIKGNSIALVLAVVYAIFYLPFVMQGVTFRDPHELFLYWNRYYFSVLMMVHIFALALTVQLLYQKIILRIVDKKYQVASLGIGLSLLVLSSLNLKVEQRVVTEGYLENSNQLFPWIKKKVGQSRVSVAYDSSIRYERHNGLYDMKVFVSRMFSVLQINTKIWKKITIENFTSKHILDNTMLSNTYLITFSTKKRYLQDNKLQLIDERMFPVNWREHFRAQPRDKNEVYGDVSESYMNKLELYVSIYKIVRSD